MTNYVNKKHGIIIGSGNVFFYRDEDGHFHDFNAVLWLKGFAFESINSANAGIRTPASQLLWRRITHNVTSTNGAREYRRTGFAYIPTHTAKTWCDQNAKGWGYSPPTIDDNNPTFFFQRRKDALGLAKFVDQMLKGCPKYE